MSPHILPPEIIPMFQGMLDRTESKFTPFIAWALEQWNKEALERELVVLNRMSGDITSRSSTFRIDIHKPEILQRIAQVKEAMALLDSSRIH